MSGDLGAFDNVQICEWIRIRLSARSGRRADSEITAGKELYRKTGEWHTVDRVINRPNDRYDELIKDQHGKVVRECHEPLSKHQGRGSAKRKVRRLSKSYCP